MHEAAALAKVRLAALEHHLATKSTAEPLQTRVRRLETRLHAWLETNPDIATLLRQLQSARDLQKQYGTDQPVDGAPTDVKAVLVATSASKVAAAARALGDIRLLTPLLDESVDRLQTAQRSAGAAAAQMDAAAAQAERLDRLRSAVFDLLAQLNAAVNDASAWFAAAFADVRAIEHRVSRLERHHRGGFQLGDAGRCLA